MFELAPKEARALNVPWVQSLKGEDSDDSGFNVAPTSNNRVKAYRVRADHPIAVYQFNPLEYENAQNPVTCPNLISGKCYSYSKDASLLLPTNAFTESYHAHLRPTGGERGNSGPREEWTSPGSRRPSRSEGFRVDTRRARRGR
jgi:hypothetical protein